ncbi:MAG TPA: hypothetical protein VFN64_14240 [Burkholderiaceae bacterium]|nr:hypothetical protein [Burkholderiaceae bacterium]
MDTTTTRPTREECLAILRIGLEGALVDGQFEDGERQQLSAWPERLRAMGGHAGPPGSVEAAVAALGLPESRRRAFETALGACSADGLRSDAETRFLAHLGRTLGLSLPEIAGTAAIADALATLAPSAGPTGEPTPAATDGDEAILSAAVTCGALGFTAHPVAAMGIIPLQIQLLHRIGRAYGVDLDLAGARKRLWTTGAGLAAQYLEVVAAQLQPGATPPSSRAAGADDPERCWSAAQRAFARTFAIGELARRHYSQGIAASTQATVHGELLAEGMERAARHADVIALKSKEVDVARRLPFVRAQWPR